LGGSIAVLSRLRRPEMAGRSRCCPACAARKWRVDRGVALPVAGRKWRVDRGIAPPAPGGFGESIAGLPALYRADAAA